MSAEQSSTSASIGTTAHEEQSGTYDGPLIATIDYTDEGVIVEPPGDLQPTFAPTALRSVCDSGAAMCPVGLTAHISLALATTTHSGQVQPDGSVLPLLARTLVYALTWDDLPCAPVSPWYADGSTPTVAEYRCLQVSLVNAQDGTFEFGFASSKPQSDSPTVVSVDGGPAVTP